jgi:hypothetical protein
MIKTTIAIAIAAAAPLLAGCAGLPSGGRNMNGFPVDPSCMAFYGGDPFYGGNLALAYGTNCASNDM